MVHAMAADIENKSFLRIAGRKPVEKKKKSTRQKVRAVVPQKTTDRLNLVLPYDLKKWAKEYVARKNTTLTQLFVDHLVDLREREKGIDVPQI